MKVIRAKPASQAVPPPKGQELASLRCSQHPDTGWSVVDGCIDLGPTEFGSYFLCPVRLNLRVGQEAEDLATIARFLVENQVAIAKKFTSSPSKKA